MSLYISTDGVKVIEYWLIVPTILFSILIIGEGLIFWLKKAYKGNE